MFGMLILLMSSGKKELPHVMGPLEWAGLNHSTILVQLPFQLVFNTGVTSLNNKYQQRLKSQISDYKNQHTWRSVGAEETFGHSREYGNHRICATLWFAVWKFNNLCSIIQESVSQKLVHKENIANLLTNIHRIAWYLKNLHIFSSK
jgi:hypothetical protein